MKKILVTGGTGFIGSHTVVELLNAGYDVDIVDNLSNSKATVIDQIEKITGKKPNFYQIDLLDKDKLNELFEKTEYNTVMHFAGLKAVAESIEDPLLYYRTNLGATINLLDAMFNHGAGRIIFSSSATVYGEQKFPKYTEDMPTGRDINNPYGRTKYMIEEILKDAYRAYPEICVSILRYFNPIGNHPSGLIGENPNGIPNNIMPVIMRVATGKTEMLDIYGQGYDTPDGTCRRDFIHVVDLAKGHLAALDHSKPGVQIYNLGTGTPTSVYELVKAYERASNKKLPHHFVGPRPGDLAEYWADPAKANQELGWKAELSVEDAIRDTLKYLELNHN